MLFRVNTADRLVAEHAPWAVRFFSGLFTLIGAGVAVRHWYYLGNPGWAIAFALGTLVMGFGFLNALQRIRLEMDRRAGTVTLSRRTLWGTETEAVALADVERAGVDRREEEEITSSGGSRRTRYHVRMPVLFVRGRDAPLRLNMAHQTGSHASITARVINDWLEGKTRD